MRTFLNAMTLSVAMAILLVVECYFFARYEVGEKLLHPLIVTTTTTTTLPNREVATVSCFTERSLAFQIGLRKSRNIFRAEPTAKRVCGYVVCPSDNAEMFRCKFVPLVIPED